MKKEDLLKIIPTKMPYDGECVTFLEGSNGLHDEGSANNLRNFLIDNKIRHNVVTDLADLPDKYLINVIKSTVNSVIAFETTGLSKEFDKIKQILVTLSNDGYRFKLIECVIDRAIICSIPKEANKSLELYSLFCFDDNIEDWDIIKRRKK